MTDPNDHFESDHLADSGPPDPVDAPAAPEPASGPRPDEADSTEDGTGLPVPHPDLPRGAAVVATAPVIAHPIPALAGRRQFARTSPVVVDRGRASFGLPSFGDRRQLGQIGLVVLMVVALAAILLARIGQSGTPGVAGVSLSPQASAHASPKVTPRPSASAIVSAGPTSSAPAKTPGASPTTKPATYKVKTGDTLSSIAIRFHTTAKAIEDLNNIKSPFVIHPGEVLKLPAGS